MGIKFQATMTSLQHTKYWKDIIYKDMELQMTKIRMPLEQQKRNKKSPFKNNELQNLDESEENKEDQLKLTQFEGNALIEDFLWIGGEDSAFDFDGLKKLGINYVLNCAGNQIKLQYGIFNIDSYKIYAEDKENYNIMKDAEQCIKFIEKAK